MGHRCNFKSKLSYVQIGTSQCTCVYRLDFSTSENEAQVTKPRNLLFKELITKPPNLLSTELLNL